MKCTKCKKTIPDKSKFCNHCGTKQKEQKLYRRPDGLYEKKLSINGKRIAFRGKTEKEVFNKIMEYNIETAERKKGLPFKTVAIEWLESVENTVSYSTFVSYRAKQLRAINFFNLQRITEITIRDINSYIKNFPPNWAMKSASGYLSVLKLIFVFAEKMEYIEQNPCALATIPKGLKREHRRAITSEEMTVINNSLDVPGGLLAYFILYSGLRRGEVAALKWSDIDFAKKTISVTKSICWHSNTPYIKEPKTETGKRKVILLDCLAQVLLPIKGNSNELIFGDEKKELYKNSKFTRLWQRYQSATGLTDVTPHMIRHGYSTMLFNAGLQAKDMQDLMGHAQFSTTMDIYTDISKEHKEATRNTLNEYIDTKMAQ